MSFDKRSKKIKFNIFFLERCKGLQPAVVAHHYIFSLRVEELRQ